jgi:hypothetical protein
MSLDPKFQPSFSRGRRWKIGLDVLARTALVLAVVVMANYLAAQFFKRFYLSAQTRVELSPRTVSVLHSMTNHIAVTLYYDRQDDFYPDITSLLDEYRSVDPRISVRTVDYLRDPGEAEKVAEKYKFNATGAKNLIIFDAGDDRFQIRPGDALIQYGIKDMSKDKQLDIGPVAFRGEMMFTSMLLALQKSTPFMAYFLQGHGEPSLTDTGNFGYAKFYGVLGENYIKVQPLELLGNNPVPADCDLLIIAGPTAKLRDLELQKIDQYLSQGGRLFALLDYNSIAHPTGLEPILQRWGVNVVADYVVDPNTITGQDVNVRRFDPKHPVVASLTQSSLQMILPRPVEKVDWKNPPTDAPQVDELAFSSPASVLAHDPGAPPRSYPLMAAIEQKNAGGMANPRGSTRIVVAGDSIFLGNYYIEGGANRDFLGYAVNWLLDRPQLLTGIGPQPVDQFRLMITRTQQVEVRWLLLGALPGAVLLLGGLVWLARRK